MPFSNGVFQRLYSWVADAQANKTISPTEFDADGNDVATALSTCILRDGTGMPIADTPWNGKKLTGLGAPINPGDALGLGLLPATEIALPGQPSG